MSRRRNVTIRTYPAFVAGRKLRGRAPEILPSAGPSVTSPPCAGGAIASSDRPLTSKKNSSNPARRIVVTYRPGTVLTFLCVCGTPLRARKIEHRFRTNRTLALASRTKRFAAFSDHAIRHLKALWARVDREEMSRAPVRGADFLMCPPPSRRSYRRRAASGNTEP